jgi:hypothetical protein
MALLSARAVLLSALSALLSAALLAMLPVVVASPNNDEGTTTDARTSSCAAWYVAIPTSTSLVLRFNPNGLALRASTAASAELLNQRPTEPPPPPPPARV